VALTPRRHASCETGSQIGIADFVEANYDLLLNGIRYFHFAVCVITPIYVARSPVLDSWRNVVGGTPPRWMSEDRSGASVAMAPYGTGTQACLSASA
jgi:hypothetical protein